MNDHNVSNLYLGQQPHGTLHRFGRRKATVIEKVLRAIEGYPRFWIGLC